jgi:hypothetical protein
LVMVATVVTIADAPRPESVDGVRSLSLDTDAGPREDYDRGS